MTYRKIKMSEEDKNFALELFKAHYTAKEATEYFPFGYQTIRNLWRGFEFAKIQKYDKMDLIMGGRLANANTK